MEEPPGRAVSQGPWTLRYAPSFDRWQPSQTWRTFLANHMHCAAAIDFFVVPTVTFSLLYVLVVLDHARRRTVHFNVTDEPGACWTAQQVINAFPFDSAPRLSVVRTSSAA